MFIACVTSAPLVGKFFNNPDVTDILRVVSISFLISILEVVSLTILTKELKFKTINIIRGTAALIEATIAVLLAINTKLGVWSLIYASLIGISFNYTCMFIAAKWLPKFKFSRESFTYLFRFGINGLGFSIMNYLTQNIDYLLVGRIFGARALGLYEFAYKIPHLIQVQIVQPCGSVLFPALSKIKNDDQRLINGYLKGIKLLALIGFPALAGLAVISDVLVKVLWGEQWIPIIVPLQILCVCCALRIIPAPSGALLYCKNRPDIPFKISIVTMVWTVLAVLGLGKLYGINGIALGMLLSVLPSYSSVYYSFKFTNASYLQIIKSLFPVVVSTFVCSGVALGCKVFWLNINGNHIVALTLSVSMGACFYVLTLFRVYPMYARSILEMAEDILDRKLPPAAYWLFPKNVGSV